MLIIVVLAFVVMLNKFILDAFYTEFSKIDNLPSEVNETRDTIQAQFVSFDYALVFLSVALIIGMIITSFFIPSHPIFFVFNIIGIFILVFVGMIMTNLYGEVFAGEIGVDSGLADIADDYPYTNYLISYLPYIGAIVMGIISVVMFAKGQGGGY
jgi:hypothetical protein